MYADSSRRCIFDHKPRHMEDDTYKNQLFFKSQQQVDKYGYPTDPEVIRGSMHVREGETLEAAVKRLRAQYPLTPDECTWPTEPPLTDEDRRKIDEQMGF